MVVLHKPTIFFVQVKAARFQVAQVDKDEEGEAQVRLVIMIPIIDLTL